MKLILLAIFSIALAPVHAEFALKDGDTVVFLGDSITAARQDTKLIETYTLLRFSDRKIRFVNAGKGGGDAIAEEDDGVTVAEHRQLSGWIHRKEFW